LQIGQTVFAVGNPHGLGWTTTQGVISQLRKRRADDFEARIIQTQAALNPGNSGGGLFDREGYLVGINTWVKDHREGEGLGFAIALDSFLALRPEGLDGAGEPGEKP
jgi:S1-C subfamily serine protease